MGKREREKLHETFKECSGATPTTIYSISIHTFSLFTVSSVHFCCHTALNFTPFDPDQSDYTIWLPSQPRFSPICPPLCLLNECFKIRKKKWIPLISDTPLWPDIRMQLICSEPLSESLLETVKVEGYISDRVDSFSCIISFAFLLIHICKIDCSLRSSL